MNNDLNTIRHSASHVLAMAVVSLFPETKLAIGPPIEDGFYYDFELPRRLNPEDLENIEDLMTKIKEQALPFVHKKMEIHESHKYFLDKDQTYKVELIKDLIKSNEKEVSIYSSGEFLDLCKGPHVDNTSQIGFFKLIKTSGAYWKGNEKNKMLTRIYGTTWNSESELKSYLENQKKAKNFDHRKIGKDLGLFIFSDLIGPGLPVYTPKGAKLRQIIQDYSRELRVKIGYQEVHTPQMNKLDLFEKSGHLEKYAENMFSVTSNYTKEKYFLKPMNCPQHIQLFASQSRSYKDLPIKYADYANLYRDEKTGEIGGLTRLRAFSQDDGHCFCNESQIEEEFSIILDVIVEAMKRYNLDYKIRLSIRDEKNKDKFIGDDKIWKKSQETLKQILETKKIEYTLGEGEAAFYGPKMDLIIKDSLNREWQLSTIQIDLNMPARFGITYTDENGNDQTPIMIHSAIIGSPERFMAILLEHYEGKLPVWLTPVQIIIVTVNDEVKEKANSLKDQLNNLGFRAEVDLSAETVGKKIRNAELQKIPYIIVFGKKEAESNTLAVRFENNIKSLTIDELKEEI